MGERRHHIVDLVRQFARGGQDQPTRVRRRVAVAQSLDAVALRFAHRRAEILHRNAVVVRHERQCEGEGLARAGAASAEHITAGKRIRQGVLLNGEGGSFAFVGQRMHKRAGHAEFGERHLRLVIVGLFFGSHL